MTVPASSHRSKIKRLAEELGLAYTFEDGKVIFENRRAMALDYAVMILQRVKSERWEASSQWKRPA